MLSWFAKILLTSTAIAPVGLTYAWVAYLSDKRIVALSLLAACLGLVGVAFAVLKYAKNHLERSAFSAVSIEAADRENMAFLLLYLLPLFSDSFDQLNWQMWVPSLVVFAAVVATGYGYHFNPLLGLLRWHFYKATTDEGVTYVLVTKKQLRAARGCVMVGQLTEYIVLDVEEESR